ncbi:hypothetical protein [Paenibacillus riograndensis]|uniref:hypothetical protein n=1 Tax=Paenibacillus riograndensis TaxID=483937 RepID=UPI0005934AF3|nr:hypothetical protein [Paenibacillus riograndensis]
MDKPLQGMGKAKLQEKKKLYRVNLKNEQKGKGWRGSLELEERQRPPLSRISTANSGTNQEISN